ncbi:amidohydrolase family protein [Saccharothrix sp. BKS2]|uniref:amidohydrolase family protein n=1 Tax=Saccharothrix sp. BKS2 TaxID=3064400 RepID=UPI0039EA652B
MSPDRAHAPDRPVLLRGGTVVTVDAARRVLPDTDVLVRGTRIAAVGPRLPVPPDAEVVDARGGIVMPGMVDTHRHLWQTAVRGYGADWTLTQYFVWFYQRYGALFRPEDIHAGNLLAAIEAVDAGVTTVVDWSHGLRTTEHAEAAVDALRSVPGRFVLAYGNIHRPPGVWATSPGFRDFARRHFPGSDPLRFQLAFDVTGDPVFPERAAFEVARDLGVPVTTHAGVWGVNGDAGVRLIHEHGFATELTVYVHAASLSDESYRLIAGSGGTISISAESEQSAGQGYPPTRVSRTHGIPVSLSMDTSAWWSGDLFSAMRATLGADRAHEHLRAHARGETITRNALRADQVVEWATRGGARALGRDGEFGSVEVGRAADLVVLKHDLAFPLLHPHGHIVFQAQRDHVHTVLVGGRVAKREHRLVGVDLQAARRAVERTVEHLRRSIGEAAWQEGVDLPV